MIPTTEAEAAGGRQVVNADTNADDEDTIARTRESRNPLHRLRDALRRRLGQESIRSEAEIHYNEVHGTSADNEKSEQKRRRLGKEPMLEQDLPADSGAQTQ